MCQARGVFDFFAFQHGRPFFPLCFCLLVPGLSFDLACSVQRYPFYTVSPLLLPDAGNLKALSAPKVSSRRNPYLCPQQQVSPGQQKPCQSPGQPKDTYIPGRRGPTGDADLAKGTRMSLKVKVKVTQSCLTLCDPMDLVHGMLQARRLEWVAFPFSRGSSQPRDQTQVSHIAGGFFTS